MKKITFLFLLFVTVATAQSFPFNHPELLVGKEVKVIATDETRNYGYSGFYATEKMRERYMPLEKYDSYTKKEALFGKTFKVLSAERYDGYKDPYKLKLEAPDKSVIYYSYRPTMAQFNYPFEVVGGLVMPDEYYCELAEITELSESTNYMVSVGVGLNFIKKASAKGSAITFIVTKFIESDGKYGNGVALLLENNQKIAFPEFTVFPMFDDGKTYKYTHAFEFTKKDLELLKANKIVGVKFIDKVVPIDNGAQIQATLNCLQKL